MIRKTKILNKIIYVEVRKLCIRMEESIEAEIKLGVLVAPGGGGLGSVCLLVQGLFWG